MSDPEPLRHCQNCAGALTGPFCSQCGQEEVGQRRSLSALGRELLDHFSNFDSRILRTLFTLIFKPGVLTRDFIAGRRQRYVPALRLYLFTTLIFFLTLNVTGIAIAQLEFRINPGEGLTLNFDDVGPGQAQIGVLVHFFEQAGIVPATDDEAVRRQIDAALADQGIAGEQETGFWPALARGIVVGVNRSIVDPAAINQPLTAWIPRLLFVMLPAFALILALLYWRQRLYLVDHMVSALHIHTFLFLLILAAIPISRVLSGGTVVTGVLAIFALHIFLTLRNAYGQTPGITFLKFAALAIPYAVLLMSGILLLFVFAIADA